MRIVAECLHRPAGVPPRPTPIVLLWGARDGGVSARLADVYERFRAGRPHAFHTPEDFTGMSHRPYVAAVRIAISLGNEVEGYGRLRFPRLLLGTLALEGPTDPLVPTADFTAWFRATLASRRGSREWVRTAGSGAAGWLGVPADLAELLGMAARGAVTAVETLAALRGRALDWYRTGTGDASFADPVDALAELARRHRLDTAEARDRVDTVLCRAFLADLRHEYDRASRVWTPDGNALVVLDGAGGEPLNGFLGVLARQCADGAEQPLLVVAGATLRAPTHPRYDPSPARWPTRAVEHATQQDWHDRRTELRGWSAFYPLETTRPAPDDDGALGAGFVDRVARGHDAGAALVRATMEYHGLTGDDPALRGLLNRTAGPDHRGDLGGALLAPVLASIPAAAATVLTRAAAAADLGETAISRLGRGEPAATSTLLRSVHDENLWVVAPEAPRNPPGRADAGPEPPRRIHPLARRVLLHRLAGEPARWAAAHSRLRELAGEEGDTEGALYHALALGEVHTVATELTAMFGAAPVGDWYRLLIAVTSAPVRVPDAYEDAESHCYHLATHEAPDPAVSRTLVTALHLHSDPFGDPTHRLCGTIAGLLHQLAASARKGQFFLTDRAAEFMACPVAPTTDRPETP